MYIRSVHLIFLLASIWMSHTGWSQILDPVDWKFEYQDAGNGLYHLEFTAIIDDEWHLYSQDLPEGGPIPTSFNFDEGDGYQLVGGVEEISPVESKYDPSFDMQLKMFSDEAVFRQQIRVEEGSEPTVSGFIEYMCCDDQRCLPPTEEEFSFALAGLSSTGTRAEEKEMAEQAPGGIQSAGTGLGISAPSSQSDTEPEEEPARAAPGFSAPGLEAERVVADNASLWLFFLIAFVAGLAGILTPCVFPMIPMTVSFFMQGSEQRGKAILKGLIFGFSIIAIYTAIGFIVSLTSAGAELTNSLSTHWIPNLIFFILFMIFAASFLGMFELVLPSRWVNSADKQADRGGYLGAFFMAFTLVLVSFSCTGPIVGALLVEAAGGLAIKPILGMFGFSLAFALPFTLFAIFPSWLKGLPKSGGWLNAVKVVLGFIVLAFGMKFLSNIDQTYHLNLLSRELYLSIWIVLFLLLGFYLLGKLRLAHDTELKSISVPRLLLAIASFAFSVYMVPGLFGAPLSGISALIPPASAQEFRLGTGGIAGTRNGGGNDAVELCGPAKYADFLHLPHGLTGYFDYDEGMECARQLDKPVLLDFKGHACSNCKEMEGKVWSDPAVLKRLREDYLIIALYTDDRTRLPEEEWITSEFDGKVKKTLGKKNMDLQITRYNTNTQPFYVLVDPRGRPLAPPRGHDLDVNAFVEWLDEGLANFRQASS